jgi:DNA-binding HxlR family transcriptional regulator
MLTLQLRELEEDGLVRRPRVSPPGWRRREVRRVDGGRSISPIALS